MSSDSVLPSKILAKTPAKAQPQPDAPSRREREAAALRDNLRKRKAQAHGREQAGSTGGDDGDA